MQSFHNWWTFHVTEQYDSGNRFVKTNQQDIGNWMKVFFCTDPSNTKVVGGLNMSLPRTVSAPGRKNVTVSMAASSVCLWGQSFITNNFDNQKYLELMAPSREN